MAPGPWSAGPWPPAQRHKVETPKESPRGSVPQRGDTEHLIYGLRSVAALLKADAARVTHVYVEEARARQEDVASVVQDARSMGVRVSMVSGNDLAALSRGNVHQGVLAEVTPFKFSALEDVLTVSGPALLLVLDGVTDPQNVGAAARAAWALGATGLILPKDRSAGITAATEKVASGALAHIPVAQVVNLTRTLEVLKKKGVWIIGLDVEGDAPVFKQDLTVPVALVIGAEHDGMRRLTREHCDAVVTIPMSHATAALNAADAAAVALYEAARQRATAI